MMAKLWELAEVFALAENAHEWVIAEPEPEIEFDQSVAWRKEIFSLLWEGLCTDFSAGRVFGKLLPLRGRERISEGFLWTWR